MLINQLNSLNSYQSKQVYNNDQSNNVMDHYEDSKSMKKSLSNNAVMRWWVR
jgi:hypothetical protein